MRHALQHLEPCRCMCARMKCVQMCEMNTRCEGVLFTEKGAFQSIPDGHTELSILTQRLRKRLGDRNEAI